MRLARRLLGLRSRHVRVDGLRIEYLEGGKGPPLVLLHGLGADKDNFLALARRLKREFRLIIPDLPGFGESDRPAHLSYAVDPQVARMHQLFQTLGLTRFHIGGNSMGGMLAGAYASSHPDQIASLWLLSPAGVKSADPTPLNVAIESGQVPPILGRTVGDVRRMVRFVTEKRMYIPGFVLRTMATEQSVRYEHHQRVIHDLFDGPGLDELLREKRVLCPTLIVWGECDRALSDTGAEVLRQLLPNAEVQRLPGVGHLPQLEAPRLVAQSFLAMQMRASTITR